MSTSAGGEWQPVTASELEDIIEANLAVCSSEQRAVFAEHRVPLFQVPIHRLGKLERVYVVARFAELVLYYEGIEEGFALSARDETGAIAEQDCNQWELRRVLQQLMNDTAASE